jgi:hypothetical protein
MLHKSFIFSALVFSSMASADIRSTLLSMSDKELWDAALSGKTGKCRIADARSSASSYCDYYVETLKFKGTGQPYAGLPGKGDGKPYGSGCLVSPGGRNVTTCWDAPNVYPKFNSSSTPICTSDAVKNAANMIRIAVNDSADLCDLNSIADNSSSASVGPAGGGASNKGDHTARKASDLLESGKIVFGDILKGQSPSECWTKSEEGSVAMNGKTVFPHVQLPSKTCKKLRRMAIQKYGKDVFLPVIKTEDMDGVSLGKLSAEQYQRILTDVYLKLNASALSEIDRLAAMDTSKMTDDEKKQHEEKMLESARKIKEPTKADISEALSVAVK